jgi:ABC-2 type transport system permease protein
MSVALAFLRRDFQIWTSYRLTVIWQLLGPAVVICAAYFAAIAFGQQPSTYGAFLLSGLAFTDIFFQILNSPPQAIRDNQRAGTLEPLLMTPVSMVTLVLSSPLFKCVLALWRMTALLVFGAIALGFWHQMNLVSGLLVFVPAALAFIALGTVSAAFVVVVKQGDPVLVAYGAVMGLLGGALFPTQTLPGWLQLVAQLFPLTPALNGLRAALDGAAPQDVLGDCIELLAMSAILLPLGVVAFNWSVLRAKEDGTLGHY